MLKIQDFSIIRIWNFDFETSYTNIHSCTNIHVHIHIYISPSYVDKKNFKKEIKNIDRLNRVYKISVKSVYCKSPKIGIRI